MPVKFADDDEILRAPAKPADLVRTDSSELLSPKQNGSRPAGSPVGRAAAASPQHPPGSPLKSSFYERVGEDKCKAIAMHFVHKLRTDTELSRFFNGLNEAKFKAKQFHFITFLFGQRAVKQMQELRRVHLPLIINKGLNMSHFERAVELFVKAQQVAGLQPDEVEEGRKLILTTRELFVPPTPTELNSTKKQTVYDSIGDATLKALVDLLYKKCVNDPTIQTFFKGIDVKTLRSKQFHFLSLILGRTSKAVFNGRDLRAIHFKLLKEKGLTLEHFDKFVGLVKVCMLELKLAGEVINKAMEILGNCKESFLPVSEEEALAVQAAAEASALDQVCPVDAMAMSAGAAAAGAPVQAKQVATTTTGSLFERVGGEPVMKTVANIMYDRIVADPDLVHFFQGIDVNRLKGKMAFLLSHIFGGCDYPGGFSVLRKRHLNLIKYKGLSNTHFDRFKGHFGEALVEVAMLDIHMTEALRLLEGFKPLFAPLTEQEIQMMARDSQEEQNKAEVVELHFTNRNFCSTC